MKSQTQRGWPAVQVLGVQVEAGGVGDHPVLVAHCLQPRTNSVYNHTFT